MSFEVCAIVGIVQIVALLVTFIAFHFIGLLQSRKRKGETERMEIVAEADQLSANLVRRLAPNAEVAGCQFRGFKSALTQVNLEFESLGLRLRSDDRCVLEGVSGSFSAGRMSAVMGPSGAGKSTFLNALSGRASYGVTTGVVRLNGKERDITNIKCVGFVPQDDVVHEALTVREQLQYSAQLRNPAGTTAAQIEQIVEDTLDALELTSIQHSVVGSVERRGISGGQRKRVNIGLELAACPSVLFLDEPTSGLDATVAMDVMNCLKVLTKIGLNIVVVIHQPRYDLFTLFDDTLLLGVGGRTVYLGPSNGVLPYFRSLGFQIADHVNPADWFMDILSCRVKNDEIPHLERQTLVDLWEERSSDWLGGSTALQAEANRRQSEGELRHALNSLWGEADSGAGKLSKDQVSGMIARCTDAKLSADVEQELFLRMGVGSECSFVSKRQFINFGLGLTQSASLSSGSDLELGKKSLLRLYTDSITDSMPMLSPWRQYRTLLLRDLSNWRQQAKQAVINAALVVIAALVFGLLSQGTINAENWAIAPRMEGNVLALGLLTAIASINVFGADRAMFMRERSAGISVLAFYASRVTINFVDVQGQSLLFSLVWSAVVNPTGGFWLSYRCFCMLAFAVSPWGYIASSMVAKQNMTLAVCVIILLLGAGISDPIAIASNPDSPLPLLSPMAWSYGTMYLCIVDVCPSCLNVAGQHFEVSFRKLIPTTQMGYEATMSVVLGAMGVGLHVLGYIALRASGRPRR